MKDKGVNKGIVQEFNLNTQTKSFYGFRKMFREYLNKLNLGFYDSCCPTDNKKLPVYVDKDTRELMYINDAGIPQQVYLGIGGPGLGGSQNDPIFTPIP